MGYSKAPEQPQSSARPMCHSHTMTNTGREPATIHIAAYRSSPRYALHHGRRHLILREEMTQSQAKMCFFQFLGHNVAINCSKLLGVTKRSKAL